MRFSHVDSAEVNKAIKVLSGEICYFDDKIADHIDIDMVQRLLAALESGGFPAALWLRITPLVIDSYDIKSKFYEYSLACAIAECRLLITMLESDDYMVDLVNRFSFHDKGILAKFFRDMTDEALEYVRRHQGDALIRAWNIVMGEAC